MDDFYGSYLASRPDAAPATPAADKAGGGDFYGSYLSERDLSPDEYAQRSQQAGINVGRSAADQEQVLKGSGQFSSQGVQALMGGYKQAQADEKVSREGVPNDMIRRAAGLLPFSDVLGLKGEKGFQQAQQRVAEGKATDEDYATIAQFKHRQQADEMAGQNTGIAILQGIGSVPKMVGEAWAGGKVLGALGGLVGGKAGAFLAGTNTAKNPVMSLANPAFRQKIASHMGRLAVLEPLMPSMYLQEARDRNLEAGRSPLDPAGFPGALLHGYSNLLVLNTLQAKFGNAGNMASRAAIKGVLGVGEQAAADVGGGLWDQVAPDILKTHTKFGTIGALARGDLGDAAHQAAVQFMTFAAFSTLHGPTAPKGKEGETKVDPVKDAENWSKDFADRVERHEKKGLNRDAAIKSASDEMIAEVEAKSKEAIQQKDDQDQLDRAENEGMPPVPDRAPANELQVVRPKGVSNQELKFWSKNNPDVPGQHPKPEIEKWHQDQQARFSEEINAALRAGTDPMKVFTDKFRDGEIDTEVARAIIDRTRFLNGDAQTNVQAPTIAQAEPKAGVGDPSSPTEIVPPANADASESPTVAPGEAPQAPEPAQAQAQTPVTQTAANPSIDGQTVAPAPAPVAAPAGPRPIEGGSGQFHVVGDMVMPAGPRPTSRHTPEEHRAHLSNWLMDAVVEARGRMTPEQHVEYLETIDKWIKSATDSMIRLVNRNLDGVKVYGDPLTLAREAIAHDLSDPRVSAEWKLRLGDELKKGTVFGGAVKPMPGDKVILRIDGGIKDAAFGRYGTPDASLTTHGVWAHEMGHVIDNGKVYSDGSRWTRIHGTEMTATEGDPPLTLYAETEGPHESFAEFWRILHGSDRSLADIERDFPDASAFFREKGWWPPERTTESTGPLGNLFEGKVELPDGGHADVLAKPKLGPPKPPPPNKAAIEARKKVLAPKEEMPAPEPAAPKPETPVPDRAPKGEWEEEAKKAGFSDDEIKVLDMWTRKTSFTDIAQKMGITPGQAVTLLKKARNKLGSTTKTRKADESGLPTGVDESLKSLFSDPRDYQIMRARLAGGSMDDVAKRTGLSKSTIKKNQDKALADLGLPEGEEGLKALQEKIDADLAKRYEGEKYMLERRRQEENDLGVFGDSQLMRRRDEPMSESERELLRSVQENPQDQTLRLILADAIEEGETAMAGERARDIRREVENPPSDKGVSHWSQLDSNQRLKMVRDPRFQAIYREEAEKMRGEGYNPERELNAQDSALNRFFAEKEEANGPLKKDMPPELEDFFADGTLVHTTNQFGPRFYGRATPGELREFFGDSGLTAADAGEEVPFRIPFDSAMTTDPSGKPLGRLSGPIKIEYKSSEYGDFGPHAEIISNEETQQKYREKKTVDFHISEVDGGQDIANMRKMVLSVTIPKKVAQRYDDTKIGQHSYSEAQANEAMRRMESMGYKRVELENGDVRYDSPLRQQLRAEQARGLRTGESQFIAGSLKSLKDALSGARSSTAKEEARKWWEKLLTGPGGMPPDLHEQKIERDNRIRVEAQQVSDAYDDLTKAVGGDWRTVSNETKEMMYRSRFVPQFLGSFKPEIASTLKTMWRHIDVLEQRLFEEGVLDNKLDVKFASYGPYLTKQHMAFIDPDWARKVDPEVVNRFRVWYINEMRRAVARGEMKEKFPDEIEGMIKEMLSGNVGKEWIDALKGRKDLPVPVRELLGEVRDPIGSYAYSIGNQARLLHNAIFIRKITELGEKQGWMSKIQGSEGWKEVGNDKDTGPLKLLQGHYAAPEVVEAIRGMFGPRPEGSRLMQAYMKVLGVFKYGKTVGSLTSHVRQSLGNTMFILRNGYSFEDLRAAQAQIKEMYGDTEKGRSYFRDLILRNMAESGVHLSEFRDTAHDALGVKDPFELSTTLIENGVARWAKKGLNFFQKLYRWEDLVPKIVAYEGEQARVKRSNPTWSPEQVKSEAAKRVNKLFPTFNRVNPTIQALRKFPLVGPFVSFSSEMIRTTYHTARMAWSELHATKSETKETVDAKGNKTTITIKVPDVETRSTGVRRMTGLVGSMSAFAALGALTRWMAGVTLEEEDAMRQFLPDSSKDSQLLHLGKDAKGKPMTIDLGRTDPHSILWEPFQAGITSARTGTGSVFDVMEAAVKPYIQEELGTRTLLDIARNKMEKGGGQGQGMVYNPESDLASKVGQIGGHILKGLEPGIVDQLLRTTGAAAGLPPNPGGKPRNFGEELLADFTGQRLMTVDPNENLKFAAKTFLERRKNAEHEVNQLVARNRQQGVRLKPEDVQAEFARGESMRQNVFEDFVSQIQAARLLGMSPGEVIKELKAAGVSQDEITAALGGKYRPRNQAEVLSRK